MAGLLGAAILLNGCLSRPSLVKESFAFPVPPPKAVSVAANGPVLGIRKLGVAPPFDSQSLVYRTGEFSYERDPYAQFLAPPAESFLAPVRDYFRDTAAFRAVAEPGSALQPNIMSEIYINQLYGDFRDAKQASSVLAMHFIFFEAADGRAGRVWLEKDYVRRVPLKARTAAALIEGWNQTLQQILNEAASDLQAVGRQPQQPQPDTPQSRPDAQRK